MAAVADAAAVAATPGVPEQIPQAAAPAPLPFDINQPPIIEGFTPPPRTREETFKEKFLRKTKENPFVPLGELHKLRSTVWRQGYSLSQSMTSTNSVSSSNIIGTTHCELYESV